ncbi:MAG: helix-turn-helix transcriptional regulator [Pseudoclavibacter sp.]
MAEPATRVLQLLSLLQVRRDWSGAELAGRLGVSDRTVRRDIDRLRDLGYRIDAITGPDGGYWLKGGADLPPLLFDDDQAVALAIALEASIFPGSGIEEGAVRALTTLRQVLPGRLRHRLDGMAITALPARPGDARPPTVSSEALVELSATVRDRRILRLDYQRPGGEVSRHRVEPHGLVTTGGCWYLFAWDLDRGDWRTLRVDRLEPRPPHGARFTPPNYHRRIRRRVRRGALQGIRPRGSLAIRRIGDPRSAGARSSPFRGRWIRRGSRRRSVSAASRILVVERARLGIPAVRCRHRRR